MISPEIKKGLEILGYIGGGIVWSYTVLIGGRKIERRSINNGTNNSNKNCNCITQEEHKDCKAEQKEAIDKLETRLETVRKENREDFGKVFNKFDEMLKIILPKTN